MTQDLTLRSLRVVALCLSTLIFNKLSLADNPASWSISEGTDGEDVFWTSPTNVEPGFPRYGTTFDFTRIEVFAGFLSLDITDQLPATSGTTVNESLPVTLASGTFDDPDSGTAATVDVSIDPNGFGQASITDVTLGTVVIIIPLNITRIEIDADISVRGVVPGDFDGNLRTNIGDLEPWHLSYGVDAGADTDFNGVTDGFDFLDWQRFFGSDFSSFAYAVTAVPEPTTCTLALAALCLAMSRRQAFLERWPALA